MLIFLLQEDFPELQCEETVKCWLGFIQFLHSRKPELCFHGVTVLFWCSPWTGGNLSTVPEPHPIPLDFLCHRAFAAEPGMEQVVMLTLVGMQALKSAGELLQQILLPPLRNQSQSAGNPALETLGYPEWLFLAQQAHHGKCGEGASGRMGYFVTPPRAEEFLLVCYGQSQTAQVGITCYREHQMSSK